jgi:hypothetical protein
MSPAEKYGRVQDLAPAVLSQAQDIGETLKSRGVTYDAGAPPTPALKYAAPANNQPERSLSLGRSL